MATKPTISRKKPAKQSPTFKAVFYLCVHKDGDYYAMTEMDGPEELKYARNEGHDIHKLTVVLPRNKGNGAVPMFDSEFEVDLSK